MLGYLLQLGVEDWGRGRSRMVIIGMWSARGRHIVGTVSHQVMFRLLPPAWGQSRWNLMIYSGHGRVTRACIQHVMLVAVQLLAVPSLARHMGAHLQSKIHQKYYKLSFKYYISTPTLSNLYSTYPQSTQSSDNMSESAKVILPPTNWYPSHQ